MSTVAATPLKSRRTCLAGFVLYVCAWPKVAPAGDPKIMLHYDILPEHDEYVSGEVVNFKLRIENRGSEAIEIPDPEYAYAAEPQFGLRGPAFPKGLVYSKLSLFQKRNPGLEVPSAANLVIEAGEVREVTVEGAPTKRLAPGDYELHSVLAWQGAQVSAAPKQFRVAPALPYSVHLGLGERPLDRGEGRLVFLQRQGDAAALYACRYREKRADIGEMDIDHPIVQAKVDGTAVDVATPWRNSPYFIEYVQWTVWREGRQIRIASDADTQSEAVTLPAEPAFLIRPPLKAKAGPTDALVVTVGNQLLLCSFPDYSSKTRPAPSVAWSIPIPATALAGVAAIGPEKLGGHKHVVLLLNRGSDVEFLHTTYLGTAQAPAFRSVTVSGYQLIARAAPAMIVDKDGRAHVSALATTKDGTSVAAIEAVFDSSGAAAGAPVVLDLGTAPAKPSGGAVLYTGKEGMILRRNMVVAVEGHGILQPRNGTLVPLSVQGTVSEPILLAPGAQFTYILYSSPDRGFYFEPI
jgi:hypothetical protein